MQFLEISYNWGENALTLDSFESTNGQVALVLNEQGKIDASQHLATLFALTNPTLLEPVDQNNDPLKLTIDAARLHHHTFRFHNKYGDAFGEWEVGEVNLDIEQFQLAKNHKAALTLKFVGKQGGEVKLKGLFSLEPLDLDLDLTLNSIPLTTMDPFLRDAHLNFVKGNLSSDLKIQLRLVAAGKLETSVAGSMELLDPVLLQA